jgi:2-keto-4-pentenoate hydratase/2-oxohepta-3-ene-1,7-dioic acid hydratase in catechol pathway
MMTARGPRLHVRGRVGYVDVADAAADPQLVSLDFVLQAGPPAMDAIRALQDGEGADFEPADFGPAVPDPWRILCLGVNYRDHAIEGGREVPTWPEAFVRGRGSVLGPYADLVKPALTERFVVLNDATARDWQRATTQWTAGKNFEGTMPVGPEVVTTDEVDISDLALTTVLNGKVMQSARTSQMIVDVPSAIEFFSSFTRLRPGDVIATGTPGGVGFARQPPVWLQPGDVIEVTVEGVGSISNRVVAEDDDHPDWRWQPPQKHGSGL